MTVQFCFAFDGNSIKAFPKRKILNDDMTEVIKNNNNLKT